MKIQIVIAVIIGILSASYTHGQKVVPLNIGDPAPALSIQQWVRGPPVTKFERKYIYVVEFASTGCPGCVKSIPHLTALGKEFKDKIKVISIYIDNSNASDSEKLQVYLNELIRNMGAKMDFIIGLDSPEQTTRKAWGITGVPKVFIVDQFGIVAWQGHPLNLRDTIIHQMVAGTFNAQEFFTQEQKVNEYVKHLMKVKQYENRKAVLKSVDSLIYIYPKNIDLYHHKFTILTAVDGEGASNFVRSLLQSQVSDFIPWINMIHIVLETRSPDYELADDVAERAIAEAATNMAVVSAWAQRINIYSMKILRSVSLKDSIETFKKAVSICEDAIRFCEIKDIHHSEYAHGFRGRKLNFQYTMFLLKRRYRKADKLLMKSMRNESRYIDWYELLEATTKLRDYPNYDLALQIADKALQVSHPLINVVRSYDMKAAIYIAKGDIQNAMKTYQQLRDFSKKTGKQRFVDSAEEKINQLGKDYKLDNFD